MLELTSITMWRKQGNKVPRIFNFCTRRWSGWRAKRSPPPNAEIKNTWSYTSTVLHVFKMCYLIKLRYKFTLCFYQLSDTWTNIQKFFVWGIGTFKKYGRSFATFRRKVLPYFSGLKTTPSKQPTRSKQQTWIWRPNICEHLPDYTTSNPRR
jgi:hypothetical protein